MISPHEQLNAFKKYFLYSYFPDTMKECGELLAVIEALKRIPSKYLSLDLQPLCECIRTKVASLTFQCCECSKNLEDVNNELVRITVAKEQLTELQNTFDSIRAERE